MIGMAIGSMVGHLSRKAFGQYDTTNAEFPNAGPGWYVFDEKVRSSQRIVSMMPDGPKPDEMVVILAMACGGRVHARLAGGFTLADRGKPGVPS